MKITIVGAAGVRTPHLVKAILDYGIDLAVKEVALFDIDARRLELIENVIREIPNTSPGTKMFTTVDPREALTNANFVIFTIRVAGIEGRILDEQIPLKYNVLGQETTGPGGFAMAMRTIPVVLDYVKIIEEVAPQAWILNLTNPAGLITQAITAYGYSRIVGICDTPSELFKDVAKGMELPVEELWFEYGGINHLGWIKRIMHKGEDITEQVLQNDQALLRHGDSMISPDFIRALGMIPVEYLMFYYKNGTIIEQVKTNGLTRATIVLELNKRLFAELEKIAEAKQEGASLGVFEQYARARENSYMKVETVALDDDTLVDSLWEGTYQCGQVFTDDPEGYAGIALAVLDALSGNRPQVIVLNTINHGSIRHLDPTDIVELPCYVDINGVHPIAISDLPEEARGLLQVVKSYERLTVEAAMEGSYRKALHALTVHPLVPDAEVAETILQDFMQAHKGHFPRLK